jgi:phage terminase Nu1 subunit (DNA packaging protein)
MDSNNLVSASELSNWLKISTSSVYRLVEEKVLPQPIARGKYDLKAGVSAYVDYLQKRIDSKPDDPREAADLHAQKVRLTAAQAHRVEQENRVRDGSLLEAAGVAKVWAAYLTAAKSVLENMPSRLAPELAYLDDPAQIERVLRQAIDEVRQNLGGREFVKDLADQHGCSLDDE